MQGRLKMNYQVMKYFFPFVMVVLFFPIVSAHGEAENTQLLSNLQIFFISVSVSLVVFLIINSKFSNKISIFTPSIFSLALLSGIVHILLGMNDRILLLGGLGMMAIIVSPVFIEMNNIRKKYARLSLMSLSLLMFIAYFISNHDIHYVLEDYLGITAKISEIGVIIGLIKLLKSDNS
ncbi:MAG: hypothetical protein ACPHBS_05115 [Candidatus Thalassarchaeaceae archaeon]|jgi:hypothetical protein